MIYDFTNLFSLLLFLFFIIIPVFLILVINILYEELFYILLDYRSDPSQLFSINTIYLV